MAFCTTARPQLTPRIVLQAIQLQLENQSLHSQVVVLTQTLAQLKGDYHRAVNEGNQLRSEASESRQAVASGQAGGDPTWQARYEDLEAKYRTTRHDLLDAQAKLFRLGKCDVRLGATFPTKPARAPGASILDLNFRFHLV